MRLTQDFFIQKEDRKSDDNVIMVGDFNVSPRSVYYKDFAKTFSPMMENAFLNTSSAFTRCMKDHPTICSHIDHLFLSRTLDLKKLEVKKVPGSDHRALVFTVEG